MASSGPPPDDADEAAVRFAAAFALEEPATSLLLAMEGELDTMYGGPGRRLGHDRMVPPVGGYVVGWRGPTAIAGGGFTRFDDGVAEIKRMYVVPEARAQGVGRQLLAAVESEARRAGYRRLILATGPAQAVAQALYRSAGYVDIESFSGPTSKASYWAAKDLTGQEA